jgi:hypothetical protein
MNTTENAREAVRLAFNQTRGFTFARSKDGVAFHVLSEDSTLVMGEGCCTVPRSDRAASRLSDAARALL